MSGRRETPPRAADADPSADDGACGMYLPAPGRPENAVRADEEEELAPSQRARESGRARREGDG